MQMWKIYTGDKCTYCTKAKRLLYRENIAFSEHNINMEENKYFLQDKGFKTVPQIYNHRDEHIGGYNELVEYMKKTLWLDKKKTSKPALPPTLDDIGANSE